MRDDTFAGIMTVLGVIISSLFLWLEIYEGFWIALVGLILGPMILCISLNCEENTQIAIGATTAILAITGLCIAFALNEKNILLGICAFILALFILPMGLEKVRYVDSNDAVMVIFSISIVPWSIGVAIFGMLYSHTIAWAGLAICLYIPYIAKLNIRTIEGIKGVQGLQERVANLSQAQEEGSKPLEKELIYITKTEQELSPVGLSIDNIDLGRMRTLIEGEHLVYFVKENKGSKISCPECHSVNHMKDAKFCATCGKKLPHRGLKALLEEAQVAELQRIKQEALDRFGRIAPCLSAECISGKNFIGFWTGPFISKLGIEHRISVEPYFSKLHPMSNFFYPGCKKFVTVRNGGFVVSNGDQPFKSVDQGTLEQQIQTHNFLDRILRLIDAQISNCLRRYKVKCDAFNK